MLALVPGQRVRRASPGELARAGWAAGAGGCPEPARTPALARCCGAGGRASGPTAKIWLGNKSLIKLNLSNWHVLHTNVKVFFTCEICEQSNDWRNKEFCEGSVMRSATLPLIAFAVTECKRLNRFFLRLKRQQLASFPPQVADTSGELPRSSRRLTSTLA